MGQTETGQHILNQCDDRFRAEEEGFYFTQYQGGTRWHTLVPYTGSFANKQFTFYPRKHWLPSPFNSVSFCSKPPGRPIEYEEIDLDRPWQTYDIAHELTLRGIDKFAEDYHKVVQAG